MTRVYDTFGAGYPDVPTPVFGTEYEIETIKSHGSVNNYGIIVTEDHSLRNSGYEYKTTPLTFHDSLKTFKALHANIVLGDAKEAFSERTSVHVHVNVAPLTLKEAREFVLLYALYEPLFFRFAGPAREASIFCVPLYYTNFSKLFSLPFEKMVGSWAHKYTAFNLLPVKTFGTIEFRHLGGTNNYTRYEEWLSAINSLYNFVKGKDFSLFNELKKGTDVVSLAHTVVPTLSEGLSKSELSTLFYDTLLDIKLSGGGI